VYLEVWYLLVVVVCDELVFEFDVVDLDLRVGVWVFVDV